MTWKDEFKNTKKVLKNGTFKEKIDYLWYYYKWQFIFLILIIAAFTDIIYTNVTAKESVLQGIFLNTLAEEDSSMKLRQNFLNAYPIDTDSQDILFDTSLYYSPDLVSDNIEDSYNTLEVILAKISVGEIDFMTAEANVLNYLAYQDYFLELSEVLTDEQYERYHPYFLYYDRAYAEYLKTLNITDSTVISFPDPTKPELMDDPTPIMIDISNSVLVSEIYLNSATLYSFAFISNGTHTERSLDFLDYIMR